jgi:hypothetical protein
MGRILQRCLVHFGNVNQDRDAYHKYMDVRSILGAENFNNAKMFQKFKLTVPQKRLLLPPGKIL